MRISDWSSDVCSSDLTPEPLPAEHALYSFPNVVITPHIASASHATRSRMARMAARNIIEVLDGRRTVNPVNRPARPRSAEIGRASCRESECPCVELLVGG